VQEIERMLFGFDVIIKSLLDFPNIPEVIEDANTFEENAKKKALAAAEYTGKTALADDSGLCVKALDNRPGVYSARFAGLSASYKDNNQKLLAEMSKCKEELRDATFHCVLVCVAPGIEKKAWTFEGIVKGKISSEERGTTGFGYDPVFIPEGHKKTFAEMDPAEKNKISHRALALKKFKFALNDIFGPAQSAL
jgi:XTP/dITP diphosphohydrolase